MEGGHEYRKRLWNSEEDRILMDYVKQNGVGKWNRIAKFTGLNRCGKSCRLRWMNYLRPNVKRGDFSEEEDDLIIRLHNLLGNRWSLIAGRVPGRTDNQVKNYWNTHLSKKVMGVKKKNKNKRNNKVCSSSISNEAPNPSPSLMMDPTDNDISNKVKASQLSHNCEVGGEDLMILPSWSLSAEDNEQDYYLRNSMVMHDDHEVIMSMISDDDLFESTFGFPSSFSLPNYHDCFAADLDWAAL